MKKTRWVLIAGLLLTLGSAPAEPLNWPIETAPRGENPAGFPTARNEWMETFVYHRQVAKTRPCDVLLQGDSITAAWPREVIQRVLAGWEITSFGISGDRVENVLWRTKNGELEGMSPRAVVLLIGTNNLYRGHAPEQVAQGIGVLVEEMHRAVPKAQIILMAVFPRGSRPEDPYRAQVNAVNERIARLAGKPYVTILDIGAQFLSADGSISREMMPDAVHPTPRGYEIWAENLRPILQKVAPRITPG